MLGVSNAQAKQGRGESGKERNGEIIKAINREGERGVFYFFFSSVILLLDWLGFYKREGRHKNTRERQRKMRRVVSVRFCVA